MEKKYINIILFTLTNIHTFYEASAIGAESHLKLNISEPICTNSGAKCRNCWSSLNCIDLGNNIFHPELQHCPIGTSCKSKTGICESEGNYECADLDKLECHKEGIFPSPFNNMVYITCIRGSTKTMLQFIRKCSPPYKFDPVMKICRKRREGDNSLSSFVPICKFDDEKGPIRSYPNIYYHCKKKAMDIGFNFIPQIYGCDFDFNFNGIDCIDSELTDFEKYEKCFNKGYFPHPTDCRKYYSCIAGKSPVIKLCPYNEKFDPLYRRCDSKFDDDCRN